MKYSYQFILLGIPLSTAIRWQRLLSIVRFRGGSNDGPPPPPLPDHYGGRHNTPLPQQPPPYGYEPDYGMEPLDLPDEEYLDDMPPPPDARNPYRGPPLPQQQQGGGGVHGRMPPPPPNPLQQGGGMPPPLPMEDVYNNNNGYGEPVELEEPYPDDQNEWDGESSSPSPAMDLSAFDKEFILKGLARLYRKKILPLELSSRYGHFHSPPLSPSDFEAPPLILLLGQYSVGKTSFIKYLLGRDFPGSRVGPEPTTDRFTAVLWGQQDKVIPGAALCSQSDRPFTGLSPFGNNFLSRMEAAELDAPILRNVTLIDTPGILSGQKQRSRNYDYEAVMKWFAERADLIIVMFDAHKVRLRRRR